MRPTEVYRGWREFDGPARIGWGTRTSSTPCDIPNWRPIGSKIFGETSGLSLPYNEAPGHLTNGTPERSNNCGQVKALIYFRVIGVAFCCNVALGTGGGTSS